MPGMSVEVYWPILIFFVLLLHIFVLNSSYLSLFYPVFSLIYFMLSPAIETQIKPVDGEMVLDPLNDSFTEEKMPSINEIIGFSVEKIYFFFNLVSGRVHCYR